MFIMLRIRHLAIVFAVLVTVTGSAALAPLAQLPPLPSPSPESSIEVTVTVERIRALEDMGPNGPRFLVEVAAQNTTFRSPVWNHTPYVYDPWSVTLAIDDHAPLSLTIHLWDCASGHPVRCDLSPKTGDTTAALSVDILYDPLTGWWTGDDSRGDASGYGRVSGCDDGSIAAGERDAELWFSIRQQDEDGDGIPAGMEELYGTDPAVYDAHVDHDGDGIPTGWEHHWGYHPCTWDDHATLDPDRDGLSNVEEYLTSQWGSDPLCPDVFLEIDQMEDPRGEPMLVTDSVIEMLTTAYHRRNVLYHVDDGGLGGGEIIPYDALTVPGQLNDLYRRYFLHHDPGNWRQGVFRYGVFINRHFLVDGHAFPGNGSITDFSRAGVNCFQISRQPLRQKTLLADQDTVDFYTACLIMHESGHTMGLYAGHPPGCDNQFSKYPWQIGSWLYRHYRSVMNYRYTYHILDYSDGTHGPRDFDDWGHLDLTFFQPAMD
ncbi:MAG: hypothetical protein PHU95_01350 [Candidatus Thermoplasmatota archaeon]|nr:hypothetical protein [Candidatus Thermoplasmatota archaeon]